MTPELDPACIDTRHEIRTLSFENPTGGRGSAGSAQRGRKGAPQRILAPGERVVLGDVAGPGRLRHIWMTFPPMPPEAMRAVWMEIYYDDLKEPSASLPCLDFFGMPHGRPVAFASRFGAAQEGRGFNCWLPLPFRRRLRIEVGNGSPRRFPFYYQIDYTLGPEPADAGLLHASFRRENPTHLAQDFTIAQGFAGPGRFFGCNVGVRVLPDDAFVWYGEGEVKMYLDGDGALPTWCGTGLEDYVGSAWGMGAHATPLQGAPLVLSAPGARGPEFVSFYRWHAPDPIAFRRDLRVTLQQIGAVPVLPGQEDVMRRLEREGRVAGEGFVRVGGGAWFGICERRDDVCATAYLYLRDAQPVPRLDVASAVADVGRRAWETPSPFEAALAGVTPPPT